jgi:Translation initiation factor 2B subunit, eIF-2B alpha/beta/delta family
MIDKTTAEIAEMQTHSSSVVAVRAAEALGELMDREFPAVGEFLRAVERNSAALRRANPSHASLQTTQQEIVETVTDAGGEMVETVAAAKDRLQTAIETVIDRIKTSKQAAAVAAAELLVDGTTILTHDYSTTVLAAIEQAHSDGTSLTVYVTEARPRYLGRKTARRLAELDDVDTRLVVDSAAGECLSTCDQMVIGMDCIADGHLYNRVGTYPIAATAADRGVPVTVVGAATKLVSTGFSFENDHRAATEVMREPADGFAIENPAYDATPIGLVETVVTDDGTVDPAELAEQDATTDR